MHTETHAGQPDKPPVKKRQVVSSFILKLPEPGHDGKPMVALFRRSDKVSTYRNCLGAVSGTIDASDLSPESAAWRELAEETCLDGSHVALLRRGKPYTFGDTNLNREWTIHPFLFQLRHPSLAHKIKIDWEHTDYGWLDPMMVPEEDEGIVPRIAESLRRVYVERDLGHEAGLALGSGLRELREDHESGARVLAGSALKTLTKVAELTGDGITVGRWWHDLRMAGWHLWRNGRPAMDAAIRAVVVDALSRVERIVLSLPADKSVTEDMKNEVSKLLQKHVEERAQAVDRIATSFASYLAELHSKRQGEEPMRKARILTLSSSSTVAKAITYASAAVPLDIRVLESRPLFEGVEAAAMFSSLPGTSVTIYPDAGVGIAAKGVDVVLLGADRISETGAVSNKIGSLPAALAAGYAAKDSTSIGAKNGGWAVDVVVLGETEKVAAGEGTEEENDAAEVYSAWKAGGVGVDVEAVVKGDLGAGGEHLGQTSRAGTDASDGGVAITEHGTEVGGKDENRSGRDIEHAASAGTSSRDMRRDGHVQGGAVPKNVSDSGEEVAQAVRSTSPASKRSKIKVRNFYFEWVDPGRRPLDELSWVYICERGRWDRQGIRDRAVEVERLTERLFADL